MKTARLDRISGHMLTTYWRRHLKACPHRSEGRKFLKCSCPIWADGYQGSRRAFRKSLQTSDMARARKLGTHLEAEVSGGIIHKPVAEAICAFLDHAKSESLRDSTCRKYRNSLGLLKSFCAAAGLDALSELKTDHLDAFRAGRKLKPITSLKELQLLRGFFGFCKDRGWMEENIARRIKGPKNLAPNEVDPYTTGEVTEIIAACGKFGRNDYERLRAKAMVLTLRFTALRVGDVAMLARDRIRWDEQKQCWRMFLRTEKNGASVFQRIPDDLKAALDACPPPRGAQDTKYYFWNGRTSQRAVKGIAERALAAVFKASGVCKAHAHRFRHTFATELLGEGASFEEVADILGNSPAVVRKHYAKWSRARQNRIDELMERVHSGTRWAREKKVAVIR